MEILRAEKLRKTCINEHTKEEVINVENLSIKKGEFVAISGAFGYILKSTFSVSQKKY